MRITSSAPHGRMQEMQHRKVFLIISCSALSISVGNATIIERREEQVAGRLESKRVVEEEMEKRVKREKTLF